MLYIINYLILLSILRSSSWRLFYLMMHIDMGQNGQKKRSSWCESVEVTNINLMHLGFLAYTEKIEWSKIMCAWRYIDKFVT